jgi:hypothetical protein
MSVFMLPNYVCSASDKMIKDFWWGFDARRNHHLTIQAWSSICTPKTMGGLGLRRMQDMNLTLLAKLGWKMLANPPFSWVKHIHWR